MPPEPRTPISSEMRAKLARFGEVRAPSAVRGAPPSRQVHVPQASPAQLRSAAAVRQSHTTPPPIPPAPTGIRMTSQAKSLHKDAMAELRKHAERAKRTDHSINTMIRDDLESHFLSDVARHKGQGISPESQQKRFESSNPKPRELTDQFFGQNPMLRGKDRGALPTASLTRGQTLFHSTAEDWHLNAIKGGIDPNVGLDEGRYKRGFYTTSHEETGAAELANTGRKPVNTIEFESRGGGKFIDVDKLGPSARKLGALDRDNAFTHEYNKGVAEWTKSDGTNGDITHNSLTARSKAAWMAAEGLGKSHLDGMAAESKRSERASKNFIFTDKATVDPLLGVDPGDPANLRRVKGPVTANEMTKPQRRIAVAPNQTEAREVMVGGRGGKNPVDYNRPLAGSSASYVSRQPSQAKMMERYRLNFNQSEIREAGKRSGVRDH